MNENTSRLMFSWDAWNCHGDDGMPSFSYEQFQLLGWAWGANLSYADFCAQCAEVGTTRVAEPVFNWFCRSCDAALASEFAG